MLCALLGSMGLSAMIGSMLQVVMVGGVLSVPSLGFLAAGCGIVIGVTTLDWCCTECTEPIDAAGERLCDYSPIPPPPPSSLPTAI